MPKPRDDDEENKSRHAAADEDCCDEMAEKYGWQLVDVEKTATPFLRSIACLRANLSFHNPITTPIRRKTNAEMDCLSG